MALFHFWLTDWNTNDAIMLFLLQYDSQNVCHEKALYSISYVLYFPIHLVLKMLWQQITTRE